MRGEYTVDAKGRLNFPAKLRSDFGDKFHIALSIYDPCLVVYNEESWQELIQKIEAMPMDSSMKLLRYIVGNAVDAEPDKQGRIALSSFLREKVGIKTNITIFSLGSKAEIWDTDTLIENEVSDAEIRKIAKKEGL